jgi:thiol-disulfide isomerase/thioredoxin
MQDQAGSMADAGSEEVMAESDSMSDSMDDANSGEMMVEAESTSGSMADASAEDMMDASQSMSDTMDDAGSEDMMTEAESMMDLPGWFQAELIDVRSGQTFTLAGQQGKVILVETMAIWCSNCLRQQQEVKALHEALGERDDLLTVVLDIDANEDAASLVAYAERHGFDWTYAVAPRDVAREIGQLYGDQFLNPPSTPMLIVDRHGEVHLLPFGRKTATDLQEALAPFLNGGM